MFLLRSENTGANTGMTIRRKRQMRYVWFKDSTLLCIQQKENQGIISSVQDMLSESGDNIPLWIIVCALWIPFFSFLRILLVLIF